jgi:polyhydroxybutyrate depolymerase
MTLAPGEHLRSLRVHDRDRNYYLYIPSGHGARKPLPVILAFHGATSNARLMRKFCGLNEKAEEAGFVAVYPNGTGHSDAVLSWNGGVCCGYAKTYNVDDVAYVRALLDDLATVVNVAPRRVYAAGMSNGAMMAYRLAVECADRFAAIAAVAGPMGIDDPRPVRPMPVLHIHGTEDLFAPYEGGVGRRSLHGVPFRSVGDTIAAWVRVNRCDPTATVINETPMVDDGTRIVRHFYRGDAPVTLITVEGGGHTWPGRPPFPEMLGKSTQNLNANDVIWEFFAARNH